MGFFDIFKKWKKKSAKTAPAKRRDPERREPPGKARRPAKVDALLKFFKKGRPRWRLPWWLQVWREIPWWGRALIIAGIAGIVLAILFAVQPSCAPELNYRLEVAANPAAGGEVSISPDYDEYPARSRVTLTATPSSDYRFASWSGDASGTEPEITVVMDADKSVTANFSIIRYTLTTSVSPAGGGLVSPEGGVYNTGGTVTLRATPMVGYRFVSWSGDVSGSEPEVTVVMDADKSATANFSVVQHTLITSVSPPGGGSVSPLGGIYDVGSQVTLTATPGADYEFVSWSGDASGAEPVVTLTMDSDKSVTANFAATIQEIREIMPTGISGSAVVFSNFLEGGDAIEGFVELTGEFYSQDWSFDWSFELINPEGREVDYWQGHWVNNNHHDFSFKAQYSGNYKIIVRHNSLRDKELLIKIRPMGWAD
ncbi:MAG: DUF4402 domain-containing protein [Dehalococcoidales bacterium]|nr:DUF4402 domain-containing protein [Dehalococcoidales bacterium]